MNKLTLLVFALHLCSKIFASTPLAGTYTIGGTTPDYATINAAITALDSNGINAPVVFNIRNGSYPELLFFSAVTGSSATNTITFQGESGDSSLVQINGATTSNQQNSVRLNGISYFTLKGVTIRQNPNVNNNAVMFIYRGNYCTISHCELYGHQSSTSSATEYSIQGNNDSGLVVTHSYIHGASNGVYLSAAFFSHRNLVIENCNIVTKLFIDGGAFATIRNNDVGGRLVFQQSSRFNVYNNYLHNMFQLISSSGWPLQHSQIYNNIILGGSYQGTVAYGFWASSSSNYDFYNNTFYMNTPTMTGYALNTDVYPGGITIQNNIVYRQDTSSANFIFRYPNAESYTGYIQSDHNLFFRNGTSITNNYSSLAAFTSGTGLDSNSVYADPAFTSSTNFYPTSTAVNNVAIPISFITTDINGNQRNPLHPTVGAYEVLSAPVSLIPYQNITGCVNANIVLQTSFTGAEPITYAWYKNGGLLANDTLSWLPINNVQQPDSGTYWCIATNSLGADTATIVLNVASLPTAATITATGNTTICVGDSVTLSGNVGGAWSTGDTTSTITVNASGVYGVTNSNTCGVAVSNLITVTINTVDTSVTVGNASFLANVNNASYQWLLCNGTYTVVPNETNQTYAPTQPTAFYAVAVTQNGCTDTSACYQMIVTSSPNVIARNEAISVYPNPAKDILNVNVSAACHSCVGRNLSIVDVLGNEVSTGVISSLNFTLSTLHLRSGFYFLKIGSVVTKVVKE